MKIITQAGCLIIAGVFLAGAVGCKKSAPVAANKPAANTNAKPVTKPGANGANGMFRTEEKTANGDDIYKLESGGIRFVVPKTWTATPDASQISLASADSAIQMIIWVPENTDYDGVANSLTDELAKFVQNAKPDDVASRTKLNGMDALTQKGMGEMDGPVVWKIDVVKGKRPFIILSYSNRSDIDPAQTTEYTALMDSIHPLS